MRKGQSVISVIFWAFIFLVFWAMVFAPMISYWGHSAVVNGGLTGPEAFLADNLNLVIGFAFAVFIVAFAIIFGRDG